MAVPYALSSHVYDLVYTQRRDYPAISQYVHELVEKHRRRYTFPEMWGRTLLDAGCGSGGPAEQLRQWYRIDGIDLNRNFLDIMRARVPDATLYWDNLRYFRNGREYDVIVWLDGGTAHFNTTESLTHAIQNLGQHLRRGGVMVVHPWHTPEPGRYFGPMSDSVDDEAMGMGVTRMSTLVPRDASNSLFDHVQQYMVGEPDGKGGYRTSKFKETSTLRMHKPEVIMEAMRSAGMSVVIEDQGCLTQRPFVGVKTMGGLMPGGRQRVVLTSEYR